MKTNVRTSVVKVFAMGALFGIRDINGIQVILGKNLWGGIFRADKLGYLVGKLLIFAT